MKVLVSFSSSVIWGEHLFSFCSILPFLRIESLLAGISVWLWTQRKGLLADPVLQVGLVASLPCFFIAFLKVLSTLNISFLLWVSVLKTLRRV